MQVSFSEGELIVVKKLLVAEEDRAKDENYKEMVKNMIKRIMRATGEK